MEVRHFRYRSLRVPHRRARGSVLIVVFVLVTILSFAAIAFFTTMRTEYKAVRFQNSRMESRLLLDSGVEYLRVLLDKSQNDRDSLGGVIQNPSLFKGVLVAEDLTIENDQFGLSGTDSATELGVDISTATSSGSDSDSLSSSFTDSESSSTNTTLSGSLQGESASSLTTDSGSSTTGSTAKASHRGRIAIVSPLDPSNVEDCGVKFGMENESGKLHLSTILQWEKSTTGAGRAALLQLPGMTETAADSILDWLDEDDEPRSFGAESEYYIEQKATYLPRNGLPQNMEELLFVQGVTRELLFGPDADSDYLVRDEELERVGILTDLQEDADNSSGSSSKSSSGGASGSSSNRSSASGSSETSGGTLEEDTLSLDASWDGSGESGTSATGASSVSSVSGSGIRSSSSSLSSSSSQSDLTVPWCRYLTICSAEKNVSRDGTARVWLNNSDLSVLQSQLNQLVSSETAEYILFYRINGPYQGNETSGDTTTNRPTPDTSATPTVTFRTVLDIIGTRCQIGTTEQQTTGADGTTTTTTVPLILSCPLTAPSDADVAKLLDGATVDEGEILYGKINIYDASQEILMAIPGMTESTVSQVIASVSGGSSTSSSSSLSSELTTTTSSSSRSNGLVPLAQTVDLVTLQRLLPWITAGGDVFRGQMIAFWDDDTPGMRMEFVMDATSSPPRQVYQKDLTLFGMGFRSEELGGEPILDGSQYTQDSEYENPFETSSEGTAEEALSLTGTGTSGTGTGGTRTSGMGTSGTRTGGMGTGGTGTSGMGTSGTGTGGTGTGGTGTSGMGTGGTGTGGTGTGGTGNNRTGN